MKRGAWSRSSSDRTSLTMPTISTSVVLSRPKPNRRPTGLLPLKKYFAIVSLMTATRGAPFASRSLNSRPPPRGGRDREPARADDELGGEARVAPAARHAAGVLLQG